MRVSISSKSGASPIQRRGDRPSLASKAARDCSASAFYQIAVGSARPAGRRLVCISAALRERCIEPRNRSHQDTVSPSPPCRQPGQCPWIGQRLRIGSRGIAASKDFVAAWIYSLARVGHVLRRNTSTRVRYSVPEPRPMRHIICTTATVLIGRAQCSPDRVRRTRTRADVFARDEQVRRLQDDAQSTTAPRLQKTRRAGSQAGKDFEIGLDPISGSAPVLFTTFGRPSSHAHFILARASFHSSSVALLSSARIRSLIVSTLSNFNPRDHRYGIWHGRSAIVPAVITRVFAVPKIDLGADACDSATNRLSNGTCGPFHHVVTTHRPFGCAWTSGLWPAMAPVCSRHR